MSWSKKRGKSLLNLVKGVDICDLQNGFISVQRAAASFLRLRRGREEAETANHLLFKCGIEKGEKVRCFSKGTVAPSEVKIFQEKQKPLCIFKVEKWTRINEIEYYCRNKIQMELKSRHQRRQLQELIWQGKGTSQTRRTKKMIRMDILIQKEETRQFMPDCLDLYIYL